MSDLKFWEDKIKEKRKNTKFRDFLKEIMSYYTFSLYKKDGNVVCFSPKSKYKTISNLEFEKKRNDYEKLGKDYDFSVNFWENFLKLAEKIEFPNIDTWGNNENSLFAQKIMNGKNCYLSFEVCDSENVLYSVNVKDHCNNIYNGIMIGDFSENIYNSIGIYRSNLVFFSKFIFNSYNIWFSSNLIGCNECIFCNDLENQSYCIKNKPYLKQDYEKLKKEILSNKNNYTDFYKELKAGKQELLSENCSGNFLIKDNNVENGYFVYNITNGRNTMFAGTAEGNKNFYDSASCGAPRGDNYYGVVGAGGLDNYYCGIEVVFGEKNYYCYHVDTCSFCLGCIGLKNKSFCILNKQYSKEEWLELADKIFLQMDKDGILGDFFPGSLNPFYFNDTMAYLIDESFTKEEVEKDGYLWRNENIKVDIPENAEIIYSKTPPARSSLPPQVRGIEGELSDFQNFDSNGNWQINPEILKKVIQDENGNIYKIVKMEYEFLVKYALPLPEIHWLDRIKLGFKF